MNFARRSSPIGELGLGNFPALGHADGVNAGQHSRAADAGEGDLRGRRNARRFLAHVPRDAIESGTFARGQLIHHSAGGIEHFDLQFPEEMA